MCWPGHHRSGPDARTHHRTVQFSKSGLSQLAPKCLFSRLLPYVPNPCFQIVSTRFLAGFQRSAKSCLGLPRLHLSACSAGSYLTFRIPVFKSFRLDFFQVFNVHSGRAAVLCTSSLIDPRNRVSQPLAGAFLRFCRLSGGCYNPVAWAAMADALDMGWRHSAGRKETGANLRFAGPRAGFGGAVTPGTGLRGGENRRFGQVPELQADPRGPSIWSLFRNHAARVYGDG